MSTNKSSDVTSDPTSQITGGGSLSPRRRRRRYLLAGGVIVIAGGTATGLAGTGAIGASSPSKQGLAGTADPTSLSVVTRRELSAQTQVSATLGYAGTYTVVNQDPGSAASSSPPSPGTSSSTYTALPAVGQVISQGEALYAVNGEPVILLYGAVPAYRSLSEGLTGTDIEQLNADLVALGYASSSALDPTSGYFGSETISALERLQAHLGVSQTGTLGLGQAIFLPTAARVTSVTAVLGGPAQSGSSVLQATSTRRQVSIALDASERSEVAVGEPVVITLPNNTTTPGVVSSVGTVATTPSSAQSGPASPGSSNSGSTPTITVLVNPTEPAATGDWDQAPVTVTITTGSVSNVLVVPVVALVALPDGGYAVEVVGPADTRQLVHVSLGLFDDADGLVQVTGSGLEAGQIVVVPNL